MNNLPREIVDKIIDYKISYYDYLKNKKKFNRVICEINDYIELCNNINNEEITPNLLLESTLNGFFEQYYKKDFELEIYKIDPFNVLKTLYGEFFEETFDLNEMD